MHLKIYNDYSNKSFPEDEKGEPLPWQRKNIEVAEIMVNPDSLIAELIWDLVDVISLPDEVFLDEINETWWDMVNNSFFPPFALKPCRKNARIYPYLKKIKELKISDNDHLVLGIDLFVEDVSLPKEFNSMREPHEKLLDRAFRWTPKKLEGLISNIIVNNKYENFVDEEIRNIRKRTGVIRDKADKKRYSDLFKRFARYKVLLEVIEPSRQEFQIKRDYYWIYLLSKVEQRCKKGLKEIVNELSSFTKKDLQWLADKGYLGHVNLDEPK